MDISEKLLNWYDSAGRTLPWRTTKGQANPYHVWMSEIMLQQTTVATVKGYFDKFLTRWPTVQDLAKAEQADVLEAWAGLGYYARARNLHKCAQYVSSEFHGEFPDTYASLIKLPGVGDYTASAVAAIAFGESVPVVDSNVERVVTRLYRIKEVLPKAKKAIKSRTAKITPKRRAGDFAQAMMDLGATLCRPKAPNCGECPLNTDCTAYAKGDMEIYPLKPEKKARPTRKSVAFALMCDGQLLLERRAETEMLGGMLGLPHTPWTKDTDMPDLAQSLPNAPTICDWEKSDPISVHIFTHFKLETQVYIGHTDTRINHPSGQWIKLDDRSLKGLPTVFKKMVQGLYLP